MGCALTTAAGAILALAGGGCAASPADEAPGGPREASELAVSRELRLPAGPATGTFALAAPDPSKHSWKVTVRAARASDLGLRIRTADDAELTVLDSTAAANEGCVRAGRAISCTFRFPALEARRAGRWLVRVSKASRPPARVAVAIAFTPLPGRGNDT